MKKIVAILSAVLLLISCRQYCCYREHINEDSIVPEYTRTVFFHPAYYYTADKRKTNINLSAMGYKLEERLFTQKKLSELSSKAHCVYPDLSFSKIIPFEEKDKDNRCGLFLISLTNETSGSGYYELPIIYLNDTVMYLEYDSVSFNDIETHLRMKGFTSSELKQRECRFSEGMVEKSVLHVNYYF